MNGELRTKKEFDEVFQRVLETAEKNAGPKPLTIEE